MKRKRAEIIPPSRKRTPRRMTFWVTDQEAEAMKVEAKNRDMVFSGYLAMLAEIGRNQLGKRA